MQRYKHGGALLITPDTSANVNVRHRLCYDRLPRALSNLLTQLIRGQNADHVIYDHLLPEKKSVSAALFQESVSADLLSRCCMSEMAGCVRFVASLSRVDGLVLMDNDLKVHGFGTEIIDVPKIAQLYRATDEQGENLEDIDASEFGTRHRSMFRYCHAHQDSLGFVVSQDGLIRAVKKIGDNLVMWENVQVMSIVNEEECVDGTCDRCRALGFPATEGDEQVTHAD